MMGATVAALLLFVVPLVPALLVPAVFYWPRAVKAAPWVPLSSVLLLPLHGTTVEYPWLLLGTRVGVDDAGFVLVLLATIVWSAAGWHARRTIAAAEQPRFFAFWLASWCGTLCVFITQDAASFYAAYAMMTFSAWGLIVHNRRPADYRAGRVYLAMAFIGEALILAGLFLVGAQAGNVDVGPFSAELAALDHAGAIAALFFAGFGVKMAVFGLHMWVPLAYTQAPTAAAAVVSGVMLKAGLAGWLRLVPLGAEAFPLLGAVVVALGVFMGFYGAAVGLCQTNPRTILAYSSPSQMLFVTVPVGLAMLYPDAAPLLIALAVAFALHHGLAKAALFLGIDYARDHPHPARLLMWLPALSLAGLPLTSGALAKVSFKTQLPAGTAWLEPLLLLASVATTLLMIRFLLQVHHRGATHAGAPTGPWYALLGASLVVPWLAAAGIEGVAATRPFEPGYLVDTAVPVAIGIGIVLVLRRLVPGMRPPTIPAGDLLALLPPPRWMPQLPPPIVPPPSLPAGWLSAIEARAGLVGVAVTLWLAAVAALFAL